MGVTVTNHAMVTHCRTLTQACAYTEGNTTTLYISPILRLMPELPPKVPT